MTPLGEMLKFSPGSRYQVQSVAANIQTAAEAVGVLHVKDEMYCGVPENHEG